MSSSAPSHSNSNHAEAWARFCDHLRDTGEQLFAGDVPDDPLIRAEGQRYLSRLTRLALKQYVEAADSDFPFFYQLSHETAKIGADNPDSAYLNATIDGSKDYRITGTRGSMKYFSIVANAMRYDKDGTAAATGSLSDDDIDWGAGGEVEIIASAKKPKQQSGNWLRLTPDANIIIIRQNAHDRLHERPGQFQIEQIGGPDTPAPLDPGQLSAGLERAAHFVRGVSNTFADWTRMFAQHPNRFHDFDQQFYQNAGGSPDLFYAHAYWNIAPDEAWVIEVTPPDCPYWNFQLNNWWMESFDYRHRQITVNNADAQLGDDGRLRIICTARDPRPKMDPKSGNANWIDTCGHTQGTALLRWSNARENPLPEAKIVKLEELT